MTMYMALVILMRNDQFRMSGNGPRATQVALFLKDIAIGSRL
jgi:hypothetical protein